MPPSSKAGAKPAKTAPAAVKTKAAPASRPAAKTASAAKPAVSKRPAVAKKPTAKPAAAPRKSAAKSVSAITPEQRRCYVEVAAYYIAERRGFNGSGALEDWVQAEAEIDRLVREGIIGP